jgi:hypothetical protein
MRVARSLDVSALGGRCRDQLAGTREQVACRRSVVERECPQTGLFGAGLQRLQRRAAAQCSGAARCGGAQPAPGGSQLALVRGLRTERARPRSARARRRGLSCLRRRSRPSVRVRCALARPRGGDRLARPANQVSIHDAVVASDGAGQTERCVLRESTASWTGEPAPSTASWSRPRTASLTACALPVSPTSATAHEQIRRWRAWVCRAGKARA